VTAHERRACWLCDGALLAHEGVSIESLGGVSVHERCLLDLGVVAAPLAAPADDAARDAGPS
jgi:hypothetical protein